MIIWEKYVKKYVWDGDKTPYLIRPEKLMRDQANKEVFLYCFFISTPAALIVVAFLSNLYGSGEFDNLGLGIYGTSILVSAILLHLKKNIIAAMYSFSAPLVLLTHFIINGFPPKLHFIEQTLMIIIVLLWMRYTLRITIIAKVYHNLPIRDMNPWSKLPPGTNPPRK